MPTHEIVDAFVAAVRAGRYVEAIESYYAPEATMRENLGTPRGGRETLIAHEKAVLAANRSIATLEATPVLIDGDNVVVRWVFAMTRPDGAVRRLDELALQSWRDGKILAEQFYYDPAQFSKASA